LVGEANDPLLYREQRAYLGGLRLAVAGFAGAGWCWPARGSGSKAGGRSKPSCARSAISWHFRQGSGGLWDACA
jgi:hypothetical protein